MSISKYFALSGMVDSGNVDMDSDASQVRSVRMDGSLFEGCMFGDVRWITGELISDSLVKHGSDELLVFIGGDVNAPENLNAQVELWIENDKLTFSTTSIVFVPAGAAHGCMRVTNVTKPVFLYTCHLNSDTFTTVPAQATAPVGTYASNWVEKYAPVDGKLPGAPEGFLTLLLWIDGKKLVGAPYMEAVWFKTSNDTGPEAHAHDFDEFIGFVGTDPDNPEDLGAQVQFYIGDEFYSVTKSCLVYIPRGVTHSPILVPTLERSILHFSGGNGGDYKREGSDKF